MRKFGVFIGRFEPFHNAHLAIVQFALTQVERLIIVIGSASQARTVKNPWTAAEREEMIANSLTNDERHRVSFVHAKDYLYNDNLWITAVQSSIGQIISDHCDADLFGHKDVVLFGHKKDSSSFYLKLFPQWDFCESPVSMPLDASHIRKLYFERDIIGVSVLVSPAVTDFLKRFEKTPEYERLYDENRHIIAYKEAWVGAPFPPVFVTTDAVLIKSGHVLVVRRRGQPGKGLIALPGGFIQQNEPLLTACIRELREETGIKLQQADLRQALSGERVFDHPNRSLRGRTITHAYCFNLGHGDLPQVKGSDDADRSWWMSLRDVFARENEFFEDHFHVISYFAMRH